MNRIDEIEAALTATDAFNARPWDEDAVRQIARYLRKYEGFWDEADFGACPSESDAPFVANSRDFVRFLIAEVKRLEAERVQLVEIFDRAASCFDRALRSQGYEEHVAYREAAVNLMDDAKELLGQAKPERSEAPNVSKTCRAVFDGKECGRPKDAYPHNHPCLAKPEERDRAICHPFDDGTSCAVAPEAIAEAHEQAIQERVGEELERLAPLGASLRDGAAAQEERVTHAITAAAMEAYDAVAERDGHEASRHFALEAAIDAAFAFSASLAKPAACGGTNEPLLTDEEIEAHALTKGDPNTHSHVYTSLAAKWARDTITKRIQERREA